MSAKIERVANISNFVKAVVKRRDSPERDGSSDQKNREQREGPEHEKSDDEQKAVGRPEVEKALSDLQTSSGFNETGMKVEVFDGEGGLRVRLAHANGAVVKVMTAEEFLKLRATSEDGEAPRGKILDQKY